MQLQRTAPIMLSVYLGDSWRKQRQQMWIATLNINHRDGPITCRWSASPADALRLDICTILPSSDWCNLGLCVLCERKEDEMLGGYRTYGIITLYGIKSVTLTRGRRKLLLLLLLLLLCGKTSLASSLCELRAFHELVYRTTPQKAATCKACFLRALCHTHHWGFKHATSRTTFLNWYTFDILTLLVAVDMITVIFQEFDSATRLCGNTTVAVAVVVVAAAAAAAEAAVIIVVIKLLLPAKAVI